MKSMSLILLISFTLGAMLDEWVDNILIDKAKFFAIILTVTLDAVLASAKHYKNGNFKTSKSLVFLFKITAFCALLAVIISIEGAFSYMDWLSEAVIIPILVAQVFSMLKHAQALNLISGHLLERITKKIDSHKKIID